MLLSKLGEKSQIVRTFVVSGDDSSKPSEATQVADVKAKRLFVTGKGHPIYSLHPKISDSTL